MSPLTELYYSSIIEGEDEQIKIRQKWNSEHSSHLLRSKPTVYMKISPKTQLF